jgi:beta-glucanase (GH16 family)
MLFGLSLMELAVWPSFWTMGDEWPQNGEIDIFESINGQIGNQIAIHTSGK